MFQKLNRIRHEFGKVAFLRVVLMIIALIAIPPFGYFAFSSFIPAVIVIVGIVIGFLLRQRVVDHFELFGWALPTALCVWRCPLRRRARYWDV